VRFRARAERLTAIRCNCSICTKKGYLHWIVPPEDFELLQGHDDCSTYRFNTEVARHTFCATCGIHPFYYPRSHPEHIDVNVHCLDERPQFDVEVFDGQNWEENVAGIR
jgi:hypothetical protein